MNELNHSNPTTRRSLIVRLQGDDDEAAWEEFVAIYRPVIVRTAINQGLQPTDAEDLAQQVLMSVSRSIPQWESDPERARFRTWLGKIVRNAAINALTRRRHDQGIGGSDAMRRAQQQSEMDRSLHELDHQWRQEAFRWAADQVRDSFQPETWSAFWMTAIEGLPADVVARQTGKSVGAVYVAKSRVMQRLQEKVAELDQQYVEVTINE